MESFSFFLSKPRLDKGANEDILGPKQFKKRRKQAVKVGGRLCHVTIRPESDRISGRIQGSDKN